MFQRQGSGQGNAQKDYDLLLTDIQMPNTDGFGVLTLLRNANIGNSRLIPIVAMTARGDQEKRALSKADSRIAFINRFHLRVTLSSCRFRQQ